MDETGGILPQVEKARPGSLVERAVQIGGPVAERAAKLWDGAVDLMRKVDVGIRATVIAGLASLATAGVVHAEGLGGGIDIDQVRETFDKLSQLANQYPIVGVAALGGGLLMHRVDRAFGGNGLKGAVGGAAVFGGLALATQVGGGNIMEMVKKMSS
ncbi:hypothetical protein A2961_03325 [Candidatus Woesebacteria bacterium RIFCSPLOWO2_01_FULL_39_21]|uniref:Uncharacterized protein n=1 Tax=Candidatus Woesebacteria bacterium RIFCSPLOWO2_01_FULL_39_21 TaxID=1802519 RepID=A0A1F8BG57_9BACT|nr:MAG: hypothetical protein A2961_03325 [Candidatus Woesebacteria bacterium RIFCSPLOWO2_01_FULL_39_21]